MQKRILLSLLWVLQYIGITSHKTTLCYHMNRKTMFGNNFQRTSSQLHLFFQRHIRIPRWASCQAHSLPARPAPMTVTMFIGESLSFLFLKTIPGNGVPMLSGKSTPVFFSARRKENGGWICQPSSWLHLPFIRAAQQIIRRDLEKVRQLQ